MQANYKISDGVQVSDDQLPGFVYVLNFHGINLVGMYGYTKDYDSSYAANHENTVAGQRKFPVLLSQCPIRPLAS